ncbi:MAG: type II toxin-antitoxin system HicA family toxin [Sneathiellaceae bacterium]
MRLGCHPALCAQLNAVAKSAPYPKSSQRREELAALLEGLSYSEAKRGKAGGSRRRFVHPTAPVIALHKPHPGHIVKLYVIDAVLRVLTEEGLI